MDVPYALRILMLKRNRSSSSMLLLFLFHCASTSLVFSEREGEKREKTREEQRKNRVEGKKRSRQHRAAGQTRCCIRGKKRRASEKEKRMPLASPANASLTTNGKRSKESPVGNCNAVFPFSLSLQCPVLSNFSLSCARARVLLLVPHFAFTHSLLLSSPFRTHAHTRSMCKDVGRRTREREREREECIVINGHFIC